MAGCRRNKPLMFKYVFQHEPSPETSNSQFTSSSMPFVTYPFLKVDDYFPKEKRIMNYDPNTELLIVSESASLHSL